MPQSSNPASSAERLMAVVSFPISLIKGTRPEAKSTQNKSAVGKGAIFGRQFTRGRGTSPAVADRDSRVQYAFAMATIKFRATPLAVLLCCASMLGQQGTTAPVTLSVTDQTGAGIPHLQIRVVPAPDPAPKMETDEKGKLSLELKPGGYALYASLSGFKPLATHFEVRATKELQAIPFILQLALNSGPVV